MTPDTENNIIIYIFNLQNGSELMFKRKITWQDLVEYHHSNLDCKLAYKTSPYILTTLMTVVSFALPDGNVKNGTIILSTAIGLITVAVEKFLKNQSHLK